MNDDLNELVKAMLRQGASEAEVARAIREHQASAYPQGNAARDVTREVASGLLPGIAPRVEAAVRAIGPETYRGSLEKIQSERHAFQREHPVASLGANVAGGAPWALLTGGASQAENVVNAGKAASLAAKAGRAARVGAATGALYGGAEGSLDGVEGAVKGAAGGAAFGAAGGALLAPIGAAAAGARNKVSRLLDRIGERGLSDNERATRALGRSAGAQELLERWGTRRERTPDQILATLQRATGAATPDDPRIMADLAPEAGNILRGASLTNPAVSRDVQNKIVKGRSATTGARVLDRLAKELGITPEDALARADELAAQRAAAGTPAFEAAFAKGAVEDPATLSLYEKLQALFPEATAAGRESQELAFSAAGRPMPPKSDPAALARYQEAEQNIRAALGAIPGKPEHETAVALALRSSGLEKPPPAAPPTVEDLHYFKQGVDRVIKGRQSGADRGVPLAKGDVRSATDLQRQFLEALDAAVPEYGAARKQWADQTRLMEALEAGREAFKSPKVTGRQVARTLAEMESDAEREMFRVGAFDAAREVSNTSGVGDEGLRALFGVQVGKGTVQRPDRLEKMRVLFGNEDAFRTFDKYLRQEIAGAETASLAGNSQTAEKLADAGLAEVSKPGAAGVVQGNPARALADEALSAVSRRLKARSRERAGEMGKILMKSAGGKDAVALLTEMGKERARRLAAQRASRVTAPFLGGLLSGATVGREMR